MVLVLQGALFTGISLAIVAAAVWWLYFSKADGSVAVADPPSRAAAWISFLLGLAVLQQVIGGYWDASKHIITGEIPAGADFLWAPHIMIYSGFLISLAIAVAAVSIIAGPNLKKGIRDPRLWVRSNPFVGAVAIASLYGLMSVPGDAVWHEIFGIDLTAWSPPHVLLALAIGTMAICAAGMLMRVRESFSHRGPVEAGGVALMALSLTVILLIATIEWELPAGTGVVDIRPLYFFPVAGGAVALVTAVISRRLLTFRWAATATAAAFSAIRLAIMGLMAATDQIVPAPPLLFIAGALLLDLLRPERLSGLARAAATSAAFTGGFLAVALPQMTGRPNIPALTLDQALIAVGAGFLVNLILTPMAGLAGDVLAGGRTASGRLAPNGGPSWTADGR